MRVLHEIHPDEAVVSRGQYRYLRGGLATGQIENWLITRLTDGTEVVRADVDGSAIPMGPNLLTHLHRSAMGRNQWLRLQYLKGDFVAAAQYNFEPAQVVIFRQTAGEYRRQGMIEIAEDYAVDYHPVIGHDYVWRGYPARAEGKALSIPVFSPDLWGLGDEALDGRALRFMVTPLASEPCEVPAGRFEDALRFKILLSDGVLAMAWYDSMGVPLRWWYPEKGYDFVLAQYERGIAPPAAVPALALPGETAPADDLETYSG